MGGGGWRWGGGAALISASAKLVELGAAGMVVVCKLRALVYDILPSTTAVFSYAIRSKKKNCQLMSSFLVGAQIVVSL